MTPFAKKISIIAALAFTLASAAYGALWYQVYRGNERVSEWSRLQAEALAQRANFSNIESLYTRSANEREALSHFVVPAEGVADFLALLESIGRAEGLKVKTRSVAVAPMENAPGLEWLTITLDAPGAHDPLMNFMAVLETLPYRSEILNVSLGRTDEAWGGTFSLRVAKQITP